ncbi:LuxR family transcriptional regulator [Streptomyces ipomoeae]|uniref:LuxR family transcriptional regulator n=1 Tax=Streptomyces ipomoeae TaxID=103232 RepID=A0AAE8W1L6_9ACTN|nr:LuxR family transcriptional regulator [Streptomyces ipomoeae]TQE27941.1 LuxR family transcriptional regulator [Streptomyces ipomoeae]
MAVLDAQLRVAKADDNFHKHFGRGAGELHGSRFVELVHPGMGKTVREQLNRLIDGRKNRFDAPVVAARPDGSLFRGLLTGVVRNGAHDSTEAVVVLVKPEGTDFEGRPVANRRKAISEIDARILEGVAAGVPSTQLASRLYLSKQGVEYHISGMLRKFQAPNRSALVSRAYASGILCIGSWPPRVLPDCVR